MNKKIIAIAIATAMAAPVAMADVKISGALGAALTTADKNATGFASGTASSLTLGTGLGSTATKSSRQAGDAGISKVQFDVTQGNAYGRLGWATVNIAPSARDFYIGYKLSGGSVQYGKMAAALAGLEGDKYNATFLQMRRTAAIATTMHTMTDSFTAGYVLQYATKVGGAALKVQYDPMDNTGASPQEGHMAVSVKGQAGAIGYFAGYNNGTANEGGSSTSQTNMKVGASMKFGAIKATVMQMNADNNGTKDNATTIIADMGMGNGMSIGAAMGQNKAKGTFTRVAFSKQLNKGTKLFGGLVSKKTSSTATAGTEIGVGMAIKF